jgi:hypothetical protein
MSNLVTFATTLYQVPLDVQYIIPIAYFVSLAICSVVRLLVGKTWLRYTLCFLFLLSFAAMWFIMLVDDSLWRVVIPGIVLFGGAAGLWGWFRALMKAFKNLGDPNSYLK